MCIMWCMRTNIEIDDEILSEAQRLGRLLRPKHDGRQAHFYTVVARDTNDQEFAVRRQRFLAEQGYAYRIVDAEEVLAERAI